MYMSTEEKNLDLAPFPKELISLGILRNRHGGSQILILEQNIDSDLLKTDKDYHIFKLVEYGVEWIQRREKELKIGEDYSFLRDGFTLHLDEEEKGGQFFYAFGHTNWHIWAN